jgi:hypothetical protein
MFCNLQGERRHVHHLASLPTPSERLRERPPAPFAPFLLPKAMEYHPIRVPY